VADVSAAAGILALRRVLLPGYAFAVSGMDHLIKSSGTYLPDSNLARLAELALKHGRSIHQGTSIRWFQFAEEQVVRIKTTDPGETREVLRCALKKTRSGQDVEALTKSIYGVVGGTLSKLQVSEPEQILGVLRQKFANSGEYADLAALPDFQTFLARRATELAHSRTGRHR
jgi:hypothetical protein